MPTSTAVTTVKRRAAPSSSSSSSKKVSLTEIDKYDAGLVGVEGAREIISLISKRRNVTKLTLAHNNFGEDGACELFRFLSSESGRKHKIVEISMYSTCMGDRGMAALAEYVEGNEWLRELSIQNNDFMGDPETVLAFVTALNASRIESLNLDTNLHLSDDFASLFLSHLSTPHLRTLLISRIGLSSASTPHILAFLTSQRSQSLETFKCNGNDLGLASIQAIISGLSKWNVTLQHVEFFANYAPEEAREDGSDPARRKMWVEAESGLKNVTIRNGLVKRRVSEEAVRLLPYARALLLRSGKAEVPIKPDRQPLSKYHPSLASYLPALSTLSLSSQTSFPSSTFPFPLLPPELQHHILSFLAPSLSPHQLALIINFASSPSTLPPLLPSLRGGHACMPDPTMPSMLLGGGGGNGLNPGFGRLTKPPTLSSRPRGASFGGGCSGGSCMGSGSVSCHRNRERVRWLGEVGCARADVDLKVLKRVGLDVEKWVGGVLA